MTDMNHAEGGAMAVAVLTVVRRAYMHEGDAEVTSEAEADMHSLLDDLDQQQLVDTIFGLSTIACGLMQDVTGEDGDELLRRIAVRMAQHYDT